MTVVEARSIRATDGDDIVVEIVKALAAAKKVPYMALDVVLADVIDTDSLAQLFESTPRTTPSCVAVTVSIDGYHVSLRTQNSERVTIEIAQSAPRAAVRGEVSPTATMGGLGE